MPVVAILEAKGDPFRLLAAADDAITRSGPMAGLLARIVAQTEDGIWMLHVWESDEARAAAQADPEHRAAVQASGLLELLGQPVTRALSTDRVELLTEGSRRASAH